MVYLVSIIQRILEMSKALSTYGKGSETQKAVIIRRLRSETKGLGYWAAVAAAKVLGIGKEQR